LKEIVTTSKITTSKKTSADAKDVGRQNKAILKTHS
jgi:hypothetical protein